MDPSLLGKCKTLGGRLDDKKMENRLQAVRCLEALLRYIEHFAKDQKGLKETELRLLQKLVLHMDDKSQQLRKQVSDSLTRLPTSLHLQLRELLVKARETHLNQEELKQVLENIQEDVINGNSENSENNCNKGENNEKLPKYNEEVSSHLSEE